MAKKRFLVTKTSYINGRLIREDMPEAQRIVEIETDPAAGGMKPGSNLVEVDEDNKPIVAKAPKAKKVDDKKVDDKKADDKADDLA